MVSAMRTSSVPGHVVLSGDLICQNGLPCSLMSFVPFSMSFQSLRADSSMASSSAVVAEGSGSKDIPTELLLQCRRFRSGAR